MDRRMRARAVVMTAAVAAASVAACAGTIRDDVPDAQYTALAADPKYAAVGSVNFSAGGQNYLGSGTLISSRWVLTAAHLVDNAGAGNMRFTVGGVTYAAESWVDHPSWAGDLKAGYDVGLIRLSSPVTTVTPAARFTGTSELGLVGTSVGYGRTGTGYTGDTVAAGTRRAGQNVIDALGTELVTVGPPGQRYSSRLFVSDFDGPAGGAYNRPWSATSTPLALEYMIAPGDSGGGTFVEVNGQTRVAGVHSFSYATDGTSNSSYGDSFGSTRVSEFNAWVDDTISVNWAAATSGAFSSGANWSGGVGPGSWDVVGFNRSGAYTVTLPGAAANDRLLARAGQVMLDLGGGTYSLSSASAEGSLVVGKYAGNNAGVRLGNGTLSSRDAVVGELAGSAGQVTVGASARWDANGNVYVGGSAVGAGGAGALIVQGNGVLSVGGTLQVYGGGTVSYSGGSLSAGQIALASGAAMWVGAGGDKVVRAGGVSIAGSGQLDLADNAMVIDYEGASPAEAVRQYLRLGRAGGAWTGGGVVSSTAAADDQAVTAIGWAEGSVLGAGAHPGVTLDGTSILLKYTYYGDANLDGRVASDDYALLDRGLTMGLRGWVNGDFNYDNLVNVADYLLIDAASWAQSGAPAPSVLAARAAQFGEAYVAQLIAVVPEPGVTGIWACALLIGRRLTRQGR